MATEDHWKGAPHWSKRYEPPGQPPEEPMGMEDMLRGLIRQDLGLSQNIPDNLRNFVRQDLRQQGYEIVGELPTREEFESEKLLGKEEEKAKAFEAQEAVAGYMAEPSFRDDLKKVVNSIEKGELDPFAAIFGLGSKALIEGMTLWNLDIAEMIEKISGKEGFAEDVKAQDRELVPESVQKLVTIPGGIAGCVFTLSFILRGAAIPAAKITKIPILQATATGAIGGLITGLVREPHKEDTIVNRLKQIPGDVIFFSALGAAAVTLQQMARIANYNRAAKFYKKVNWEAPQVPPGGKPFTARQMRDLFQKMSRNQGDPGLGLKFTEEEEIILEAMKEPSGWKNAVKKGWIKPTKEWITTGGPEVMPRKPQMKDIFRDPSKIPLVERPMAEAPPVEEPIRPAPPPTPGEVRPPIAEIPPPEAPLARRPPVAVPPGEVPPVAAAPVPPEVVPAPEAVPAKVPPPAINIRPTAEGGWVIDLPQPPIKPPPGWVRPGPTIPWRPVEPEFLPPHEEPPTVPGKKPPKVIKPRKKPVFKNPFYEAINQLGGVKPNPDYPHKSLIQIFPPSLIRNTGMPMDTLAQAMAHEFPTLEDGDVKLYEMADDIMRARATFRDERTGDETIPPDEIETQARAYKDRKPHQKIKADFDSEIKVAVRDNETGIIHKGRPEESIHAEVWGRLGKRDKLSGDMDAGFTLPDGQFIYTYSIKKPEHPEWVEGPEIDREELHKNFVKKALDEGKYIPPEALAQHKIDYPELFKVPVKFEPGDTVEFDTITGVRTGEIIGINKKEGLASIRDEQGVATSRDLADLRKPEIAPEAVPKEVPRVAEVAKPRPLVPSKEPSLTEIEKVFEEMAIPRIKRGVLADQIIRNYKPEISPLKTYIKSLLPKITEEGEWKKKPTLKRKKPERLTPEMEEVVPGGAERPEDIFERAEEEARVQKIFKQSAKTDRERDILDRKILKGQSYDDIGKAHGITRQRAEQIFKQTFDKVKDHPDVKDIIKRKMRQANLGPIPSERDLDDFVKFIRRYFTTTKGVDKVVDAMNDTRIRSRYAEEFGSSVEGKELKRFLKKNKNDALDAFVISALKGEFPVEDTHLPSDVKKNLSTMRDRIDKLSQLIMTHGAQTEATDATFEAGLGQYVGKFYRLHQQRRWDPPKEVKDRFKAMLKREMPDRFGDFTEEELDNFVNGEIAEERKYGFGTKKERRVPTEHYKRRMKLSPEWKELAGEIHDPVWLYLKTISTQAAMAYNAEFLNKIKQTYPDLWTSDKAEAQKLGWQKYQLPTDYGYGELKGMFVNKELYNYIKGELDPGMHAIAKAIQQFITHPFKATKTILSVPTQSRNFFTNFALSFLARNAIFNPANLPHYQKAIKVFLGRNTTYKKEWEKLTREGIAEVQYYGSEIPRIQSDLMKLDPIDWADNIWKIMSEPPKFIIRKLGNLYNFNDVLFRIAAYYKHTKVFKETPAQAVKEIDIALQNYRKLPEVVNILRKYPVFGPFVSFQWNMGKIMVNQALEAGKEMKSKNPKIKIKGTLRLSRLLFVIGLPLVMTKVANEVFDIDEKLIKRLGEFLPKWRRQGNFVYFRGKKGQLKAFDLTYIWPTGEIEKATRSLLKGDFESFKNSIDLLSHPIFDAWSIMIEGRQPYWGTKIPGGFPARMAEIIKLLWIPGSAPIPSLKSLTESMKAGKFLPRTGAITPPQMKALIDAWNQEPDRYGRVRVLSEEVKGFLTGLKTFNVYPDMLLMQSIKAMRSEASTLKWELTSWIASHTKAPAWEIKDRTDDFDKRITKLLEKASEAMELYKELKKGGFLVQKEK